MAPLDGRRRRRALPRWNPTGRGELDVHCLVTRSSSADRTCGRTRSRWRTALHSGERVLLRWLGESREESRVLGGERGILGGLREVAVTELISAAALSELGEGWINLRSKSPCRRTVAGIGTSSGIRQGVVLRPSLFCRASGVLEGGTSHSRSPCALAPRGRSFRESTGSESVSPSLSESAYPAPLLARSVVFGAAELEPYWQTIVPRSLRLCLAVRRQAEQAGRWPSQRTLRAEQTAQAA